MALDVRLGSTVHRVEDHQTILRPSVLDTHTPDEPIGNSQVNNNRHTYISTKIRFCWRASVEISAENVVKRGNEDMNRGGKWGRRCILNLLNSRKNVIFPQRFKVGAEVSGALDDEHHIGHLVVPRLVGRFHGC